MNQHQTERVRSYLRGRLQLAILPVGGGVGGFIVAPLGQATGSGDYYPTLEELAARHGVAIPESIMHGPLDNQEQPPTQPHKPTEEEQRQIDEMGHCGDFYALSDYLEERGLDTPIGSAVSATSTVGQNAVATIERAGTKPMSVHKSTVIRFLQAYPDEREQVIPEWPGTIEEYIAELERRPGQFFVNGELVEED